MLEDRSYTDGDAAISCIFQALVPCSNVGGQQLYRRGCCHQLHLPGLGTKLKRTDGPPTPTPLALVLFLSKLAHYNHNLSRVFDLRVPLLALTVRHFCPTDYNSLWAIIQLPSLGPAAVSPNIISFMHILSVSLLSGIIPELNFSPAILASGAARFMG